MGEVASVPDNSQYNRNIILHVRRKSDAGAEQFLLQDLGLLGPLNEKNRIGNLYLGRFSLCTSEQQCMNICFNWENVEIKNTTEKIMDTFNIYYIL